MIGSCMAELAFPATVGYLIDSVWQYNQKLITKQEMFEKRELLVLSILFGGAIFSGFCECIKNNQLQKSSE